MKQHDEKRSFLDVDGKRKKEKMKIEILKNPKFY